jgi:glycosyltransferase involved in cell wall biosynthesis
MIDILHLIVGLGNGGAERQLVSLATGDWGGKFRHRIVSMTELNSESSRNFQADTLGMRRGIPSPVAVLRLLKLLHKHKPHILHCWMYHANLLGILGGKLASVAHIIWSIRCSDVDFTRYRQLTWPAVQATAWLSGFPDAIVYNSMAGAVAHSRIGYSEKKVHFVPNGITLETFHPDPNARRSVREELNVSPDTVLVGLVARFDPMKDHSTFLRAAKLLKESSSPVHFVLIGADVTWHNASLHEMVFESGLEQQIHLLGSREDIHRLTAALDISTSSSAFGEGFSNALGEAMASGVPCVATDVGDAAIILGDTGKIVPPRDPRALAKALAEMIDLPAAGRIRMGRAARERVLERFSSEQMFSAYRGIYDQVIGL